MKDAAVDMSVPTEYSVAVLQSTICTVYMDKRKGSSPKAGETRTLSTWRVRNTDRARRGMKRGTHWSDSSRRIKNRQAGERCGGRQHRAELTHASMSLLVHNKQITKRSRLRIHFWRT